MEICSNSFKKIWKIGEKRWVTKINASTCRSLIESVIYLALTSPDIVFTASLLSRFMKNPSQVHNGAHYTMIFLQRSKTQNLLGKLIVTRQDRLMIEKAHQAMYSFLDLEYFLELQKSKIVRHNLQKNNVAAKQLHLKQFGYENFWKTLGWNRKELLRYSATTSSLFRMLLAMNAQSTYPSNATLYKKQLKMTR